MSTTCGIRCLVGAIALALSAAHADAAIYESFLNQSNTTPPFPDGTNYLQVLIKDGTNAAGVSIGSYTTTSSDVVFTVSTLTPLSQYAGAKYGLDEFAFNTKSPLNSYSAGNFVLPTNWSIGIGSQNADGFGKFELIPGTNGANSRLDPLTFAIRNVSSDFATTYFELASGNAGQGNYYFAAHVLGFSVPNSVTSAWFGGGDTLSPPTEVPALAAGWLVMSDLSGLIGLSPRRKSDQPTQ